MPYDEHLVGRIRAALLPRRREVEEKKMMGGLTFMVNDKICVGVSKDKLMARIDPDVHEVALQRKGCHEMNFTGKPMKGFVFVNSKGTSSKKDLNHWVKLALDFNKKAKVRDKNTRLILGKFRELLKRQRLARGAAGTPLVFALMKKNLDRIFSCPGRGSRDSCLVTADRFS